MRNGDGTLSILSTLLDRAAAASPASLGRACECDQRRRDRVDIGYMASRAKGHALDVNRNQPTLRLPDPARFWRALP
jgi:hypothetical protein